MIDLNGLHYAKMKDTNKIPYKEIRDEILNKKVHFISDCEFFPDFDVIGKVYNVEYKINETLIYVKVLKNNKKITIGSNMKGLKYEVI